MDRRFLMTFLKQLHSELRTLDEVIEGLERFAAGKSRRGRPRKFPRSSVGRLLKADLKSKSK